MRTLLFILAMIPLVAFAQEDEEVSIKKDNSKYLGNVVPVVDGRVVFSNDITAPGKSKEQLFERMLEWAQKTFRPVNDRTAKVLYSNIEEGTIVCRGDKNLVFTDKALILDQSTMIYRFIITCTDGNCNLVLNNIIYQYEDQKRITAEEWITDENSMNKKKTRLYRMTGKFRIKTVDFVENLFQSAEKALQKETFTANSTH